jgi:soluble lytic murein transglycosylase
MIMKLGFRQHLWLILRIITIIKYYKCVMTSSWTSFFKLSGASCLIALASGLFVPQPDASFDKSVPHDHGNFDLPAIHDVPALSFPQTAFLPKPAFTPLPLPEPQEMAALKRALEAYRNGKIQEGEEILQNVQDPAAKALAEWTLIRSGAALSFTRISTFLKKTPEWPPQFAIRRLEDILFSSREPAAKIITFFNNQKPLTPSGRFALAKAYKVQGDTQQAIKMARALWREDNFGSALETKILSEFSQDLRLEDHRFRMERLIFREEWERAFRAATLAGPDYKALVTTRRAVADQLGSAPKLIAAIPTALQKDSSYIFVQAQYLRRQKKAGESAKLIENLTRDPNLLVDGDEWWVERRLIARQLLDQGDAEGAYKVVSNHVAQSNTNIIEAEFHSGWIALRFLNDAEKALPHFIKADSLSETPISVARTAYWRARALEHVGQKEEANRFFERAASYPIAYYGQMARTRLGRTDMVLRPSPANRLEDRATLEQHLPVRALRILHALGLKEQALPLFADLAKHLKSEEQLEALGDVAQDLGDPRALLSVGKTGVQRGFALDHHAFPIFGIPFASTRENIDKALVFAIARQESAFDPRALSGAGARGLMQMMPDTARRTAQRFNVPFEVSRLTEDAAYNARLGAAHLNELSEDWAGSLILMAASYNAGGGNVRKWIDAYGDPRKASVDPIDWVERIPFSETRNYVQRVVENYQVYRHRLNPGRIVVLSETDMARKIAR